MNKLTRKNWVGVAFSLVGQTILAENMDLVHQIGVNAIIIGIVLFFKEEGEK
jgi:uncharacterized membrane protein